MNEYSFRDGDKILQKLITSDNKEDKYYLTPHIRQRAKLREINIKYLESILINEEPLGILSSRRNRFKIFYSSEIHPDSSDLIIVIAIDDEKIICLTTYEDSKTYRERIIEWLNILKLTMNMIII